MIVNSFNKYLLYAHSMPGTALSTKTSAMNKADKNPCSVGTYFQNN